MKGDRVIYEWVVETIEEESGDILETEAFPDRQAAERYAESIRPYIKPDQRIDIGLSRNVWESDGTLADRQYAYLLPGGNLPNQFDGGVDVPKRFRR